MGIHSMIVGVTDSDLDSEKQEFRTAGVDYCFEKPLTPERINLLLNDLNN
ncbi:SYP112 protein [Hibiscus syriacus]|uniref:SYP112 protein n=2 Tax=Hibiscus syriacus TaxID=106335 RepID=A0A6A3CF07_HIBSY|nr:SYP112 protein [Hibiscus syriacus]